MSGPLKGTILIAEDQPSVRRMVRTMLAMEGYEVLSAENGPQALEVARRHSGRIDLLLTDVQMPEMDGWQLAKRITILKPEVKVVFMSGYASPINEPATRLLQKPFTRAELTREVRVALSTKPLGLAS